MLKSLPSTGLSFLTAALATCALAQTPPQLVPYTARLIAGSGTTIIGTGGTCPASGNRSTDPYGDGCLATEVLLGNNISPFNTPGARSAVSDANGNIFFTDYNNALVRRVDALTGVVTAVAGGATANPALGTACGTGLSIDTIGDGCPGTFAKLSHPAGIAFAPNGDLYFSDIGNAYVRKIAATAGLVPATGGIISIVAGSTAGTFGYGASNATITVTEAAGNSYLRAPYGIAFDKLGDLFIVDEYTEAILVLNTNLTGSNTVNATPVPAGTIVKIAGSLTANTVTFCTNGTATGYGCAYGLYVENVAANGDQFDSTYSVAVGPDGTVYAGDEYYDSVFKVSPAGVLSTYAGIQNSVGAKPTTGKRGTAGSFGVGSVFGVATDPLGNVYFTDASSGAIWRVDATNKTQYIVAGGATANCTSASDTYGDGCPATQATFGKSGTGNYATATLPGPGLYGITADLNSNLFFGDTELNVVREVATGAQFGRVGQNVSTTDVLDVHFISGDSPGTYTITSNTGVFTLGTAICTINSPDNTTDCLLPVTARPTTLGAFSGTLQIVSTTANGGTTNVTLSGYAISVAPVPATRTVVSYTTSAPTACTGTTYAPGTTFTMTASVLSNGNPTGSVKFYLNGTTLLGTSNLSPTTGTATLAVPITTLGPGTISAVYSGDTFFTTSTGTASPSFTIAAASVTATATPYQQTTVTAGGSGLYSFTLTQNVYAGTLTFACSGLPTGASCVFSPSSITANGCSTTNTVALTILTTQPTPIKTSAFGSTKGAGPWQMFTILTGLGLALTIGLRRRRGSLRYGQLWMSLALLLAASGAIACGNGVASNPGTPSGTYNNIMVTTTGTSGVSSSFPLTLIVK